MDKAVKEKWVAALRSGEYTQAQGTLKNAAGGFCCLGVLCDLYAKEKLSGRWDEDLLSDQDEALPAQQVCHWAGFPEHPTKARLLKEQDVSINGVQSPLSTQNDAGATFEQIAAAIEAQL